jgi:predicted neutral ceramidase superfamily lipid hydrolase
MKCPYCNEKIELTTKRYFGSLFGKHNCPNCFSKLKIKHTKIYFLWIFLSLIFVIISSLFILSYFQNQSSKEIIYFIWLVILFIVYTFIDRKIENKMLLNSY